MGVLEVQEVVYEYKIPFEKREAFDYAANNVYDNNHFGLPEGIKNITYNYPILKYVLESENIKSNLDYMNNYISRRIHFAEVIFKENNNYGTSLYLQDMNLASYEMRGLYASGFVKVNYNVAYREEYFLKHYKNHTVFISNFGPNTLIFGIRKLYFENKKIIAVEYERLG